MNFCQRACVWKTTLNFLNQYVNMNCDNVLKKHDFSLTPSPPTENWWCFAQFSLKKIFCNSQKIVILPTKLFPLLFWFDQIQNFFSFLCCYPHRFLSKVCEIVTVFPLETHAILENKNTIPNLELGWSGSGSLSCYLFTITR